MTGVTYSVELTYKICGRLVEGESLRSILRDADMPSKSTIFEWLRRYPEFAANYDRALEARADTHVEEILDIADNGSNDWMATNDPDNPGYRANGEHIQRSRLRVDTRKWSASKMRPKKYGDKLDLGTNGGPLHVIVDRLGVSEQKK